MVRYDPSNSECFKPPRSLFMALVTIHKFQNIHATETKNISETYEQNNYSTISVATIFEQ